MAEVATLTQNKEIQLPADIAVHFRPSDRFLVWLEGDTMHLKRLTASPMRIVEGAPDDESVPLDEIEEIVHSVCASRRQ